jgi:hypothetical protein
MQLFVFFAFSWQKFSRGWQNAQGKEQALQTRVQTVQSITFCIQ